MKKIVWPLAALALLAAIGFKVASDPWVQREIGNKLPVASYVAQTRQITQPADDAANGICRGTMTVEIFSPDTGVVQADVDTYNQRYKDEARSCDELTYLGNVQYPDGSADYIYRMNIAGKPLWYIFTIADGLVTNIQ